MKRMCEDDNLNSFRNYEVIHKEIARLRLNIPMLGESRSEIKKEIKKKLTTVYRGGRVDPDGQYIYPGIYKEYLKG